MSGLAKRLGTCVRELRLAAGLTQVEFSERCGFYQTYLSRVETGRANPSLNALEVLANGLGMSVFDLFEHVRKTK
ncbi:MAG TPA: helix-turn-helix transcriptional regulator [Accumulibacter sp.]|nr:helix-turn-helix transcriptional regulator [Accumulibacter sp.]